MMIHHYKPERHMQKMGCCLQGQSHSNWIWAHMIKSWLAVNVLKCWLFCDQLECLVKRLLFSRSNSKSQWSSECRWLFGQTVSSDKFNLVWWCIIMSQCVIQKHYFAIIKAKAHILGSDDQNMIISTISLEILDLLQPN